MAEGYAPPPSPLLSSLELVRAMAEMTTLPGAAPILAQAPRGDGHPVLVFPGFTATDDSTWVLRRYLQRLGYEPMPWELGRNLGGGSNGNLRALLNQRLIDAFESSNERKVSLVGWSLGGVYARALAPASSLGLLDLRTRRQREAQPRKVSRVGSGERGLRDEERHAFAVARDEHVHGLAAPQVLELEQSRRMIFGERQEP